MGGKWGMLGSRIGAIVAALFACSATALPPNSNQFDLICDIHSRFVREVHTKYEGTWRMPVNSTHVTTRYAVDLKARKIMDIDYQKYCAANDCSQLPFSAATPIERVDPQFIVISSHPYLKWKIRRRDGWFVSNNVVDPYLAELSTGHCRRAKFSGLPAAPAGKAGRK